jgi:hypothetical protein
MSVSGISASASTFQTPPNSQQIAAFRQNFNALAAALQSGNLQAAQSAFATLSQNLPSNGAGGQNNPFTQALSQIGSDLQSGNLSGAQQALSSLQSQIKGHHHTGGSQGGSSPDGAGATSSNSTAASGSGSDSNSDSTTTTVVTNPDGSTTTTVTNADGSIVSITTTAAPTGNQASVGSNGTAALLNITV